MSSLNIVALRICSILLATIVVALLLRSQVSASTPFGGVPISLPGTIDAASFDDGGPGVAYGDNSPGNSGGAYRQTDVDIERSSDGGYDLGWIGAGEWVNYTVNVVAPGPYVVRLRIASPGGDGSLHLGFNGPSNVWDIVPLPATGGWQNWTSIDVPVTLGAGQQQVTLLFDTGGFNVSSIEVSGNGSTSWGGAPAPVPGTISPETFDVGPSGVAYFDTTPGNSGGAFRQTDVDLELSADGGFDAGWIDAGEWMNYTVSVAAAGSYTLAIRVASPSGNGMLHVGFNGPSNAWNAIPLPPTGGWQNWMTVSTTVTLNPGVQQLTVYADTGGFNIGTLTVSRTQTETVPAFTHIYVIPMENEELTSVIGSGAAPYINALADQYGVATAYTAITHPSQPNYMALTSGATAFTDDCVGCTANLVNIADRLEAAGRTWKAYMEDMPAPCVATDSGLYAAKHDPFVHYVDIVNSGSRCGAHVVPFSAFYTDLAAGALPSFTWITPNLCNDMHDCGVAAGDRWLSAVVPQIIGTPDFSTSVLFIVWDEGTTNVGGGGLVPLIVVSPSVHGVRSTQAANHYDLLRTITDAFRVQPLGAGATARALTEFFRP
jgi:hypothetical protein